MTAADPRHKRIPPERTGPIRNALVQPPPRPATAPANPLRDALECAVQTAYTVIDDYMRRGYEAARGMRDHPNGRGHMHEDRPHYGSSWNNPWGSMGGPFQQWMAAMQAWTNAWSAFVPGAFPQQMWNGWAGATPPTPVSVHVTTYKPIEVQATAHLSPGAEHQHLTVGPLTNEASEPLHGLTVHSRHGTVHIGINVPAAQATGAYHGDIMAHDRVVGGLRIVLAEPPKQG